MFREVYWFGALGFKDVGFCTTISYLAVISNILRSA